MTKESCIVVGSPEWEDFKLEIYAGCTPEEIEEAEAFAIDLVEHYKELLREGQMISVAEND